MVTLMPVLVFLDILLTIVHLVIIFFNLFGWAVPALRRFHLWSIIITAASWFILGIWFGIGYCPVTDWQWRVKEQLGESNLPGSFITYMTNNVAGASFTDNLINVVTLVAFILAAAMSVYVNFLTRKRM
jgi:hypothetical protein